MMIIKKFFRSWKAGALKTSALVLLTALGLWSGSVSPAAAACSGDRWPCFSSARAHGLNPFQQSASKKAFKKRRYSKKKSYKKRKSSKKRRYNKRKWSKKRRYNKRKYSKKRRYSKRRRYTKKSRRTKRNRSYVRSSSRGRLMAILKQVKPKGLPIRLAAAVVTIESRWRTNATGSAGEIGLMQLMPATARSWGGRRYSRRQLYNPAINMRIGTKYLYYCYKRARGNVSLTIGCYNRGPGLMHSWSGNHITRRYVSKVRSLMG